jgi:hypothetical protein
MDCFELSGITVVDVRVSEKIVHSFSTRAAFGS